MFSFESTLTRQEFVRHALTRHFRRPAFYLYAFVCAALTTYAFFQDEPSNLLLAAAWVPVLVDAVVGWVTISRRSRDQSLPLYLPTRYEFSKGGLELSSRQGRGKFSWSDIRAWRKVVGLYELSLTNGQLLVISQRAVPPRQVGAFEDLLTRQITPKPERGIFDQ
jgi:hypothetical protein